MPRIEIVDYRPAWVAEFTEAATEIRRALADLDVPLASIQHIGSTAVPGLAAKDVIDIQVTVADLNDARLRDRVEGAGLRWWADVIEDHTPPGAVLERCELEKRLAGQGPDMRRMNVHFRIAGRFNHRYALLCRDYLREHPSAAAAYGEIKRNLARLFPDDVESYYDVKDPVFDLIMAGAEDWAGATAWSAGS